MKSTKILKMVCAAAMLAAVTAAFFGVPFADWVCKVQPSASWWFLGVIALSFLWGRFFCEAMCPLGILQTLVNRLFHPKTPTRRVCSRLPETRSQQIVRYAVALVFAGLLAAGVGAAWMIAPYGIYGKALALFTPGLVVFATVMVLAALGKGRIWCNWICPFGTLFNLVSKVARRRQEIGPCCRNCRACFPKTETATESKSESERVGVTRREALQGVALLAAAETVEKTTDGGFAPISLHASPDRAKTVLPPGAGKRSVFERTCVGCELCVKNCPGECLRPSMKLKTFGQPEMDFTKGHCILGCTTCATVCPAQALEKLDEETKLNTHVGVAVWKVDRCLRTTEQVACQACVRKCPVQAIHDVKGVLVVDAEACLGCGACEHVCAARPLPAIEVEGLDDQRIVRRIGEGDLVDEMLTLIAQGTSIVVARDGVITARETGSGVKPILDLLEKGTLKDALVVDKIIGRAAAAACVQGGAKKVVAQVMSQDAKAFLNAHGIPAQAQTLVPMIINRKKTGMCPMEARVKDLTDPKEMVAALKEAVKN